MPDSSVLSTLASTDPCGTLDIPLSAHGSDTRLAVSVPVANVRTTSRILDDELGLIISAAFELEAPAA
jgi:hypothetical protein